MKRIDLYATPSELERASLDARPILVVDVLRSCTTIATALQNGAAKIIPVKTVEEATRLHETLDPKTSLLCGEREGRKVSGFQLGNSPREFTRKKVNGSTLIFASTNASPLMAGPLAGRDQILLSYVNLSAVVKAVSGAASGGLTIEPLRTTVRIERIQLGGLFRQQRTTPAESQWRSQPGEATLAP